MGLDMYLEKDVYVGAYFEHNKVTGTIDISMNGKPVPIDLTKVSEVIERAGYWRKANAIHGWFVKNVQDGADDCKRYYVSWENLQTLKQLCIDVLLTKDASRLPPTEGFFFGSSKIDDWYWKDLQDTVAIIEKLDPDGDYHYHSSW